MHPSQFIFPLYHSISNYIEPKRFRKFTQLTQLSLPLFDAPDPPDDTPDGLTLLRDGAVLVLSVSGGKDSDAMTHHLLDLRQSEGWTGDVMMVHADLGSRVEWHQTPDYVRDLAVDSNVSAK